MADDLVSRMTLEHLALLQAYADGVNDSIPSYVVSITGPPPGLPVGIPPAMHHMPWNVVAGDAEFEPWTPQDCILSFIFFAMEFGFGAGAGEVANYWAYSLYEAALPGWSQSDILQLFMPCSPIFDDGRVAMIRVEMETETGTLSEEDLELEGVGSATQSTGLKIISELSGEARWSLDRNLPISLELSGTHRYENEMIASISGEFESESNYSTALSGDIEFTLSWE